MIFFMKRPRQGSTIKQMAYATRMMNGSAESKKEAALLSGFSMSVAENAKYKIESTEGYKNAMVVLHTRSNNLLNAIMHEFEVRGLEKFSNKDLVSALNAISSAWDKIDTKRAPNKMKTPEGNPLRAILTRRVETETATFESAPAEDTASATQPEEQGAVRDAEVVDNLDLDF